MNPTRAHTEFWQIMVDRYHLLELRMCEKRDKLGRIYQVKRDIPFDVRELGDFVEDRLGGIEGHCRCEYCNAPLDLHTIVLDHRDPLEQGGSLALENVALCCERCNDEKGAMTKHGYMALKRFLYDPAQRFTVVDVENCLGRLRIAIKAVAGLRRVRRKALPAPVETPRVTPHVRNAS